MCFRVKLCGIRKREKIKINVRFSGLTLNYVTLSSDHIFFEGDLVVRWGCERKIKDENQKLRHTVTSHTRVMT